jgi:hypothetical protein
MGDARHRALEAPMTPLPLRRQSVASQNVTTFDLVVLCIAILWTAFILSDAPMWLLQTLTLPTQGDVY